MTKMFAYYEREERMNTKGVSFAFARSQYKHENHLEK